MDRTRVRGGLHADHVVHVGRVLRSHREFAAGNPHHARRRGAWRRLRVRDGGLEPARSAGVTWRWLSGWSAQNPSVAATSAPTTISSHRGVPLDGRSRRPLAASCASTSRSDDQRRALIVRPPAPSAIAAGELVVVLPVGGTDVGAFVHADVGGIVGREDVRVGVLDATRADLLAVDEDRGRPTLAAAVAVVGEVERDRRLAGREPLG